ncbi:MAG TPA: SDR family oxidoreductase [Ramlibacter sp.]|uniref:SDR family NAD(P)-dependent oxidoreductase n=1 Tax=Ramlibacter sp. TaxID=1917967 RepID=UPI002B7D2548|nr:SDR family oxidoreductase [Ramlibacter sp.]HVZ45790.1 SDR family oxidoreductase [Ramlibacter sp.]
MQATTENPLRLDGKTALVVGGSSGIGNAIAQKLRAFGARVHVWGTRASASDYEGVEGSDLSGLGYAQVDVADSEAVKRASDPFDRLDILVLSQGIVLYKRQEFQIEGFRRVVDVNLNSLMGCAARFHDALAASKGSMIVISSAGGIRATRGNPAYGASKAAAIGLVKSLAQAWAHEGIRVNAIAPGLVDTKLTKVTVANPERLRERLEGIPLGRLGTTEEIAGIALFLSSPLAGYVVGDTIVADGGRTL